jgi:cbb3-type cytochrome oxidase maturation protein
MSPKRNKRLDIFVRIISKYMSALFLLIGISILVAGSFLAAFLWSVKNGQYDDDYTPSVRMLFDDEIQKEKNIKSEIKIQNK